MVSGPEKEFEIYFKNLHSEFEDNSEMASIFDEQLQHEVVVTCKKLLNKMPAESRNNIFDKKIKMYNGHLITPREFLEKNALIAIIRAFELNAEEAQEEMDEEQIIETLQDLAKAKFTKTTKNAVLGQFKRIEPFRDIPGFAVAIANNPGEDSKVKLEQECELLGTLAQNNLPAIKTYGDVFEISKDRFGVLMDWVPNATLLDGKDPDAINVILPYLLLGEEIPSGEARVLYLPRGKLESKINDKISREEIGQMRDRAAKLSDEFSELINTLKKNNVVVGDLQLLISDKDEIFIIDPIDVLYRTKDRRDTQVCKLHDAINGREVKSIDFEESIRKSEKMLKDSKKWLKKLSQLEDTEEFKAQFLSPLIEKKRRAFLIYDPPTTGSTLENRAKLKTSSESTQTTQSRKKPGGQY